MLLKIKVHDLVMLGNHLSLPSSPLAHPRIFTHSRAIRESARAVVPKDLMAGPGEPSLSGHGRVPEQWVVARGDVHGPFRKQLAEFGGMEIEG